MGYNVLIVDDSASMRKIVRKVLAASGFDVANLVEAGNGREALRALRDHPIDLVLTDINMPVMNGVEFLRTIRQHNAWRDLPVIMITTEGREDFLKKAFDLGAKGYLRKPFRPEAIRSILAEVMGEPDGAEMEGEDDGCDF